VKRALVSGAALLLALAALIVAYGYYGATRTPIVVRYNVGLADWPAGTPPLTIVQLSDIHFGVPDMPAERVARIVAQANALKPDLTVLTGDYHGGKLWDLDSGNLDNAVRPLKALRARYGVFAVRGNHDGPYWTPIVFARTPITLLQNRWVRAGPIVLAGVDDISAPIHPVAMARTAVAGAPPGVPLILAGHEPEYFQYVPPRVDLVLAGHTHGAQIVLPLIGAIRALGPFLDSHLRGHFIEHGQQMIVSSGLGTSIVPLRIGVPPEIALITVGPDHSVGRKSGTDR
jgi:hypothetical protein